MIDFSEIVSVPIIATAVYWLIEVLKVILKSKSGYETFLKFVPCISGVLGGGLGLVAFYIAPSLIIATNWVTAIVVGIASGLTATGTNQIFKQLNKSENDKDDKS